MASPASTETIEIRRRGRRRLVGAIAIVVLLVVFVPMLLDSEPHRHANEPAMQIPPQENAPPLPAPQPAPVKAAPEAPSSKATPTPAKTATTPAKAAPRLEGFAVQVGAFKDEETLREARAKLAAAGVPHYTERIGGGLTRLRAGPFSTREAADKARGAIQQASLEAQVVPLP